MKWFKKRNGYYVSKANIQQFSYNSISLSTDCQQILIADQDAT